MTRTPQSFWRCLLLAAGLSTVAGCGGGGPGPKPAGVEVAGKVYLPNGNPVTGGTLVLRPETGIYGASGPIQTDGSFRLSNNAGEPTVVPGQYRVYVRLNDDSPKTLRTAINKRYQDSEDGDSDVVVDIREAKRDLVIRLNK